MAEGQPVVEQELRGALQREATLREELRAKDVLLRDAEHFRRLVEACPDYIFFQDRALRYRWASQLGSPIARENLLGKTDFDLHSAADAEQLTAVKRRVLETGAGARTEFTLLIGVDERYYEAALEPARSKEGPAFGLFGYARDITARKRAEAYLNGLRDRMAVELAGMKRLQEIGQSFMLGGDLSDLINEVLRGAIAVTGADKGTFQLVDESGQLRIVAHRGLPQSFIDFFDRVNEGEAACGISLQRGERVVVEDVPQSPIFAGSPALDVLLSAGVRAIQSTPIVDRFGRPLGVLSTHYQDSLRPDQRDERILDMLAQQTAGMIGHRRAEEERGRLLDQVEKANERLVASDLGAKRAAAVAQKQALQMSALLASMPSAVDVLDASGRIVLRNEAARKLTGVPDEAAPSIHGYDDIHLFRPDGRPVPADQWPAARLLRGDECPDEEYMLERRDGTRRRIVCSGSVVRDEQGTVALAIIVSRDVTEMRHLEQMRQEYVSLITHDLRAPLTTLMGLADWIRLVLQRKGMEREAHNANTMVRSARRMNTMLQELAESASLESGLLELHKEPTDLVRFVAEIAERTGTPDDRNRINVDAAQSALAVTVDRARVERALTNLITNALKYSPTEKPVRVCLREQDGKALISVADEGVGIPPEDLSRIFERSYRAKTAGQQEGLGLGLYITRLIAEAHCGQVCAESELGKGSVFFLSLPLG